jgi:UDP-N-acetylglucosamine diphosphorylase/glucosamine-1-phosphate N-acetyltransferase
MTHLILFDAPAVRENLLPLTFTRPVALLRVGIGTIADHWRRLLGEDADISYRTVDYLQPKFPEHPADDATLFVAGHVVPDEAFLAALGRLSVGQRMVNGAGECLAWRGAEADEQLAPIVAPEGVRAVEQLYHIFGLSKEMLTADFRQLTAGRRSQPISSTCTVIGDSALIFIEEGADVEGAFLNTRQGPIYIGRNAEVQEMVALRGPLCIDAGSRVRAGARLLPGTNVGPKCKVGGEVSNAVFFANSNKQHDGYLGDAVIGEWCNLGAGCTSSNLKNDYSEIRLWNYASRRFLRTGLQFCGLIMGDHSKAGINTMFNTATVVGVGCNIHGAGFPRTFVPSFSDGGAAGFTDVIMSRFFDTARKVTSRRGVEFTAIDEAILNHINQITAENK